MPEDEVDGTEGVDMLPCGCHYEVYCRKFR